MCTNFSLISRKRFPGLHPPANPLSKQQKICTPQNITFLGFHGFLYQGMAKLMDRGGNYKIIQPFLGQVSERSACPVLYLPVPNSKQWMNFQIWSFPSEKYLKFLSVLFFFYLSQTSGQSVISIPAFSGDLFFTH